MVIEFGSLFEESINRKRIAINESVTFIGMQDVDENATIQNYHERNYSQVKSGFTYFEKDDVLVAKITPCFENGKGGYANDLPTKVGFGSTEFHILRAKEKVNSTYIYYISKTQKFRDTLESEMVGSAGHRRVPFSSIQKYELSVQHTYKEQTAIANALSDVDALIASIEKLIAKKQAIKTATMQQLLTGKKRLPPFDTYQATDLAVIQGDKQIGQSKGTQQTELGEIPEDWAVKTMGDIFTIKSGFSFSGEFFSNTGPIVLTPGNFKLSGGLYFEKRNTKRYSGIYPKSARFSNGDLLIVMTDLTPDCNLLGKPAIVQNEELVLHNQRIGKLVNIADIHCKMFLYYSLLSPSYLSVIKEKATGSTVRHTSNGSIYSAPILVPSTKLEQVAIANVLSDIDLDIEALNRKKAKTQQIKQGMMQELLTGRTRLPFNKDE